MEGLKNRQNSIFIALIHKKFGTIKVKDYRLITLVGELYKIFSKVMTNRLSKVLE